MFGLGFGFCFGTPSVIAVPSPLAVVQDSITNFSDFSLTELTINNDVVPNYEGDGQADQTRETAVTGAHALNKSTSVLVTAVQYYSDFVLKPDGRSHALIQAAGGSNNFYGCFDFTDNSIGLSSGNLDSWNITDLSNGWKFIRIVFTAVDTSAYAINLYHAISNTVYTGIAGDITKGFILDRYVLSHAV